MNQKLLIISSVWVEPNSSAAGSRMLQLIDLFKENNFEIHYASTALQSAYAFDIGKINCFTHPIEVNNESFDLFITNLNPTIVLFDRFMIEEQFGWRVSKYCPNALKILDTEDLHCLRTARSLCVKENKAFSFEILKQLSISKREIASIYRCDISIIISEFEMDLLKNHFTIPDDLLLYLPLFGKKHSSILNFDDRKDIAFIGNFLHEPNFDAVQYLYKNIWSGLKKKLPNTKMQIYGAYPSKKVLELHKPNENFIINGRAENSIEVLLNSRVLLAPIRFGAGIKGKFIDAMQAGTPVVTTIVGAEAMTYNNTWNGFIEDDVEEIILKTVTLYNNPIVWKKHQEIGFAILEKKFNSNLYKKLFKDKIDCIVKNLATHRNKNFIGAILNSNGINSYYYMSKWIEEKNKKLQ